MTREWVALCAQIDPALFFIEDHGSYNAARKICHDCTGRVECLEQTLDAERGLSRYSRYGMYAGLTPGERADLDGAA